MKLRKDPKYVEWAITALAVIAISIILALVFSRLGEAWAAAKKILTVFSPVFYGLLIAYILNTPMCFAERHLTKWFEKSKRMKDRTRKKLARALSITFAMIVALGAIYGFFALLLPSLVQSLTTIVSNMQGYYDTMLQYVDNLAAQNPDYGDLITTAFNTVFNGMETWLTNLLENDLTKLATSVATQLYSVVKGALNILIGFVAAVYLLSSKETFQAQSRKVIIAVMKRSRADRFFDVLTHSNRVFNGFIVGKIIDSFIIAVLCYIGMLILRLPYPELISVIIGITNIIPFFGPIIGAVPSALLILLIKPIQALYFVIFILALQQLDGNLIGPHILGDKVGLPSFWILVSITVFGGLFGFVGMLFGVPLFAVIYMLVGDAINNRLKKKGAPTELEHYYGTIRTEDLENAGSPPTEGEEEITEEELRSAEEDFWK